jgi:hypothetical protein
MSFLNDSIKDFVVGSEENELYMCDRHAAKQEISRSISGTFLK